MPTETVSQFLTRISHPLIERAGFVFYGIKHGYDTIGVQFTCAPGEEPLTLWLALPLVTTAMSEFGPRALAEYIEEKLAELQQQRRR